MIESQPRKTRLIALCGKGGTGKTAISAMITRVLIDEAESGTLLLIDADPAMGLPHALGTTVKRTMGQVREEIIKTARGSDAQRMAWLSDRIDYMVFEALIETDKFALLAMGRTESLGCFCPVNDLLRDAIEVLSQNFATVIIDGEAGLEQINRQVIQRLDTLIIVSDATSRGIHTASQIKKMVQNDKVIECGDVGLVFNRVQQNASLLTKAAKDMDLRVLGYIPQDEEVARFDLIGKTLLELPPDSSALTAVRTMVDEYVMPRNRYH